MAERPRTVASCSISLDGYLDAGGEERLVLSSAEDLRRVDGVRAWADAIMVGAATVRNDDPRLLVRDPELRRGRIEAGRSPSPTKVTLTRSGDLDPTNRFFTTGDVEKLVYCPPSVAARARRRLGSSATVVGLDRSTELAVVLDDLHRRGVRRLMVEGGGCLLTQLFTEDLVDELHLSVAPFFVGTSRGRRFVGDGEFPFNSCRRASLRRTTRLGDVVLLHYDLASAPAMRRAT
ncbi:hypothetical protein GCM10009623_17580 [Nocardioides aestuarii]|uniref:RibD family protein n=1 Tax=Nocardioides aestuarii TaxID=252231 RepID=A0ABW4TLU9_9ACTN